MSWLKQLSATAWIALVVALLSVPVVMYAVSSFRERADYQTGRGFRQLYALQRELDTQLRQLPALLAFNRYGEKSGRSRYEREVRQNAAYRQLSFSYETEKRNEHIVWCDPEAPRLLRYRISSARPETRISVLDCRDEGKLGGDGGDATKRLAVSIPLGDLLAHAPRADLFPSVLIADADGTVLHQGGAPRLTNVMELLAQARTTSLHKTGLVREGEQVDDDTELGRDGIELVPTLVDRDIAGRAHRAFVVPLRLPWTAADQRLPDQTFYIVGLWPTSDFQQSVLTLPVRVWAQIVTTFVLLALAWPWFKIWFSGPQERIHGYSGPLLVITLLLGTGLVCLSVMDGITYRVYWKNVEGASRQLAEQIDKAFTQELNATLEAGRAQATQTEICSSSTDALALPASGAQSIYPDFELAVLLDDEGHQHGGQITYRSSTVANIDVPDRQYFRSIIEGRGWKGDPGAGTADTPRYYVQRIRTYDHGLKLTAVSMTAPENAKCNGGKVLLMLRRFLTFLRPAVPLGYAFAVVQPHDGLVLYHSDDARGLSENFYDETDRDDKLFAAMREQRSTFVRSRHHGREHGIYTQPLHGTPFSLIVLSDGVFIDVSNFNFMLTSALQLAVYVFMAVLTIALTALFVKGSGWKWIWPDPARADAYRRARWVVGALIAYQLFMILELESWWLVAPAVAVPAAGTSLLFLWLGDGELAKARRHAAWATVFVAVAVMAFAGLEVQASRLAETLAVIGMPLLVLSAVWTMYPLIWKAQAESPPSWRRHYVELLFLCAIGTVVAQAAAIFMDSYRVHAANFVRMHQLHAANALQARTDELQSEARRLKPQPAPPQIVAPKRLASLGDYVQDTSLLYDAGENEGLDRRACRSLLRFGAPANDERTAVTGPAALALRMLPLVRKEASFFTTSLDPGARDGRWGWKHYDQGVTLCHSATNQAYVNRFWEFPPKTPEAQDGYWLFVVLSIIALLVGLLILYSMIRSVANRVLGLELEPPPRHVSPKVDATALESNRLFIRAPSDFVQQVLGMLRADGRYGDPKEHALGGGAAGGPGIQVFPATAPSKPDVVVVRDLIAGVTNPEQRGPLLGFLEQRVFDRGDRVFLFADGSPSYRLMNPDAYPETAANMKLREDERLRWPRLLAEFHRERFPLSVGTVAPRVEIGPGTDPCVVLESECGAVPELRGVREELRNRIKQGESLSPEQVVDIVASRAEDLYQRIWVQCTVPERLLMIQLAEGGLVNPRNGRVVGHLIRRGLVRRTPRFELANHSFEQFVRSAERPQRVRDWERGAGTQGQWRTVQVLLVLALGVTGAAVLTTQREDLDLAAGAVPIVLAGLGLASRVLPLLRRGSAEGTADVQKIVEALKVES